MPKSKTTEIPHDSPPPHAALYEVIEWLGIGFETTLTQASDGSKLRIRIEKEERAKEKSAELTMLREFHSANVQALPQTERPKL